MKKIAIFNYNLVERNLFSLNTTTITAVVSCNALWHVLSVDVPASLNFNSLIIFSSL